jgi:hypothetical protein
MLRRSILLLGYLLIFAAALVGLVDGTRWIANGVFAFTPVETALKQVGITQSDADWMLLPALPSFLTLGLMLAVLAIIMLGKTPPDNPSVHDL